MTVTDDSTDLGAGPDLPGRPAPMTITERGIYHHVQCHGCGNEAHIVRNHSPAPAYAMTFLAIANFANSLPRGLADAEGIGDSVRLAQEALASFVPDDGPPSVAEPPAAPPGPAEAANSGVWVTVSELLDGRPLPPHPETLATPCGVTFEATEATYCAMHLLAELGRPDALPELTFDAAGEVLYRTPTTCVGCAAEAV